MCSQGIHEDDLVLNGRHRMISSFLAIAGYMGTHLGRGSGSQNDDPPTGLLTKTRPDPWGGFSWAGFGEVYGQTSYPALC